MANFLAHMFEQGYQSRSLNAFRSAISSVHDKVGGIEVGKHSMVIRLLKSASHARLPLPHYTAIWDVHTVYWSISSVWVQHLVVTQALHVAGSY